MQSLFPQSQPSAGNLIEFKAGKCTIASTPNANGKFLVTPDTSKRGKITLVKQDGLLNFKWTNAVNGVVEDTRIVLPGENLFQRVNTGKETDRVYILKSVAANQHMMYWLQDKATDKDEANTKRVSDLMINPNAPPDTAPAAGGVGVGGAGNAMSPDAWMNAMGIPGRAGAAGAPSSSSGASSSSSGGAPLDFASLLSTIGGGGGANVPPPAPAPAAATSAPTPLTMADLQRAMQPRVAPTPPLQDILSPDDIASSGVLQDPTVIAELLQHLPTEQQSADQLESTVRSPQFQQSLGTLSQALAQPENYNTIMNNFGINAEPGVQDQIAGDGVGAFLTSLSAANPPEENAEEKKDEEKKEDSKEMDQL